MNRRQRKAAAANQAAIMRQAAAWGRGRRHIRVVGLPKPIKAIGLASAANLWQELDCPSFSNDNVPAKKPIETKRKQNVRDFYVFKEKLRKRGFQYLGSGAFSTVMGKPGSDRVIKLNHGSDDWIDYVYWAAKAGYAGNFAPKVFSYKKMDGWRVMVMERLDSTINHLDSKHDMKLVSVLADYAMSNNVMAAVFMDELAPGLTPFLRDMKKAFPRAHDYHGGNWMVQGDKRVVLCDPVSGPSKLTQTRLKAGDFSPALRRDYYGLASNLGKIKPRVCYNVRQESVQRM